MVFENTTILFFAPKFFGYEKDVLLELESRNAKVFFLPDRPSDNSLLKAIYRVAPSILNKVSDKYYISAVEEFLQNSYDYIFIQSGEALTVFFLQWLRKKYTKAKFIFYTYDSISNKKGQLEKIRLCDVSYSFDKNDAEKYGMCFRPLFFSSGFESKSVTDNYEYDLSFVGTAHSDRYYVISKLKSQLGTNINSFIFLYMQAKWLFFMRKLFSLNFKDAKIDDFSFSSITKQQVIEIFSKSKAILDIEHPSQTGLTMRTFEALGAQKKLITTNASVKNMDFYNLNNILVIDRKNPHIPASFLLSEYEQIPRLIYDKYTIRSWVNDVFSG